MEEQQGTKKRKYFVSSPLTQQVFSERHSLLRLQVFKKLEHQGNLAATKIQS